MDCLSRKDVMGIFESISNNIKEKKDELIRIDSVIGDGDLGLTMDAGFSKICENFVKLEEEKDLGNFIKKSGFAMAGAAPSTMGTLVATGIMKSADAVKGTESIPLEAIPAMLKNAIAGIEMRGKAKRGEKTILDALYPALEELEKAVAEKKSFKEVFEAAYKGAHTGVESTIHMKSTHGKAAVYGDKSVGKQDPGATAAEFIIEGIFKYFEA